MKLFRNRHQEHQGRFRYFLVEDQLPNDQESVFGSMIDPLSGEPYEGGCRIGGPNWHLEEVDYPIDHSFEIDSTNYFQPPGYPFKDGINAADVARRFLLYILEFLRSKNLLVPTDNKTNTDDLRIMSADLTGTGFDFLRQHYRRIKLDCLFAAGVVRQSDHPAQDIANALPTNDQLSQLLIHSQNYPTNDSDWPLGEWIEISSAQPLTLDNYPLIQTVWNLNLSGDQITDLSILQRCVRLKCLTLNSIPIHDLSALSNVRSLVNLKLKDLDLTDPGIVGEISSLKYLSIVGMQIDLAAIEKLDRLQTLFLSGVTSRDSLEAFRKARPNVKVIGCKE